MRVKYKSLKRERLKHQKVNKIERFSKSTGWATIPAQALIEGQLTTDVTLWQKDMGHWLERRFSTCTEAELARLRSRLGALALSMRDVLSNRRREGTTRRGPTLWHTLQAWATAQPGKAGGPDRLTLEMLTSWPLSLKIALWRAFGMLLAQLADLGANTPEGWELLELTGIQKPGETRSWEGRR